MNLKYLSLDFEINLDSEYISTLFVEDFVWYRRLVNELIRQLKGDEGEWALTNKSKIVDLKKEVFIISDFLILI